MRKMLLIALLAIGCSKSNSDTPGKSDSGPLKNGSYTITQVTTYYPDGSVLYTSKPDGVQSFVVSGTKTTATTLKGVVIGKISGKAPHIEIDFDYDGYDIVGDIGYEDGHMVIVMQTGEHPDKKWTFAP